MRGIPKHSFMIVDRVVAQIRDNGFAHLTAVQMRPLLWTSSDEWRAFAASWNDLGEDRYMADGGRYRRRRHSCLWLEHGQLSLLPPRAHFQNRDYNRLNGGIERWFDPIVRDVVEGALFRRLIESAKAHFRLLNSAYLIEAHQFRIEASAEAAGLPTPEGMHRDGVDFVLVLLVARENVQEGITQVAIDGLTLASFTLAEPMEAVLLNDRRVSHGVTAITPLVTDKLAYRDVLVVTFAAVSEPHAPPTHG